MADTKTRNDERCFCCGSKNDRGLKLSFSYPEEGRAETSLTIPEYFTGWEDLTHGGLISMLLDETMAHACLSRGTPGVTAELTVRFKKPLPVESIVSVQGRTTEVRGRTAATEGQIQGSDGTVYATARAKFFISA